MNPSMRAKVAPRVDAPAAPSPVHKDRAGRIERYGVEYIPEDERRSSPRNLGNILFGGSLTFSVIIIGWFPVSFGLSWWQAASAVVVGSAVGAALLAPTGLMGPRSGTNNPVSSGAFFGVAGRLIGSILEASASVAFAALSIWTGGDALAGALTRYLGLTDTGPVRLAAYAILSVVVTVVSVLGHSSMVFCQKIMIPTAGACLIVGLFVYGAHFDPSYPGTGSYALGSLSAAWLLSALLCASTVASYGPYAGDWTRHISPKLHPDGSIVRALFLGGMFGMGGPFMWGVFTSVVLYSNAIPDADTSYVLALVNAAPLWFIPALIYVGLASGMAQAVINTYGTGLDTSAIIPKLNRVQATLLACLIATVLVYVGHFYSAIAGGVAVFLALLACSSIPWIVILTIGHFHRGGYYPPTTFRCSTAARRAVCTGSPVASTTSASECGASPSPAGCCSPTTGGSPRPAPNCSADSTPDSSPRASSPPSSIPWPCGCFPSRRSYSPRANPTRRRGGSDDGHRPVF